MRDIMFLIITFGLIFQFPSIFALNSSETEGLRSRRYDYFRKDSSLFIPHHNPFRPFLLNRPSVISISTRYNFGEHPYMDGLESRSRFPSRFSTNNFGDLKDDSINPASRILSSGNNNGNTFLSGFRWFNPLLTYQPCNAANNEEMGICLPSPVCSFYGGRATGGPSCRVATTCCINEVTKCGALVTINNTYWQSPASVSSESTCGLTVKLDQSLVEQKKHICQIRLDFITFSIAQPNSETVCNTDTFHVAGSENKIPVICGDNDGQHMYLHLPPDATSAQLLMTFGTSNIARTWRIKISLLPCDASYLAPDECLQYFTTAVGSVLTFNWKDSIGTAARQLANQDYYICFRTELVNKQSSAQIATTLCLSQCQVTNNIPFSVSGIVADLSQVNDVDACSNDYMVFPGGYSLPIAVPVNYRDRYCGTKLAQGVASGTADTICSTAKPFRLLYRTNADESITDWKDTDPTLGNQGFCLYFEERLS